MAFLHHKGLEIQIAITILFDCCPGTNQNEWYEHNIDLDSLVWFFFWNWILLWNLKNVCNDNRTLQIILRRHISEMGPFIWSFLEWLLKHWDCDGGYNRTLATSKWSFMAVRILSFLKLSETKVKYIFVKYLMKCCLFFKSPLRKVIIIFSQPQYCSKYWHGLHLNFCAMYYCIANFSCCSLIQILAGSATWPNFDLF